MSGTVTFVEVLILAVVQGITEWLPVSSSGHLVILQQYLGIERPVAFDVMLHLGTLCVILVVFRQDIIEILKVLRRLDFESENGKLALFVIVGNIPTAIIGLIFQEVFESFFENLLVVGVALLVTGCVLFVSELRRNGKDLSYADSFLIGVSQGVSLIPGISRSGVTIATGLLRKVSWRKVLRYSFLLSIPAVMGAAVGKSKDLTLYTDEFAPMLVGVITSMVVGYVSLKLLLRVVMKRQFHLFAYYCWVAGAFILLFCISNTL